MAGTIFLFSTRPPASHLWPVETIQAFPQAQAASKPIPLACQPDQGPLFGALPPRPNFQESSLMWWLPKPAGPGTPPDLPVGALSLASCTPTNAVSWVLGQNAGPA